MARHKMPMERPFASPGEALGDGVCAIVASRWSPDGRHDAGFVEHRPCYDLRIEEQIARATPLRRLWM
jgi:hypothetical protein